MLDQLAGWGSFNWIRMEMALIALSAHIVTAFAQQGLQSTSSLGPDDADDAFQRCQHALPAKEVLCVVTLTTLA